MEIVYKVVFKYLKSIEYMKIVVMTRKKHPRMFLLMEFFKAKIEAIGHHSEKKRQIVSFSKGISEGTRPYREKVTSRYISDSYFWVLFLVTE